MDVVKRGSRVLRIFAAKAAPTLIAVARDELLVARKNLRQRNSQYTVHGELVKSVRGELVELCAKSFDNASFWPTSSV